MCMRAYGLAVTDCGYISDGVRLQGIWAEGRWRSVDPLGFPNAVEERMTQQPPAIQSYADRSMT